MYGSVDGTQALVRHLPFDGAGMPTTVNVASWLEEATVQLEGLLVTAGYTLADITTAPALRAIGSYANHYAAGMAELSMSPSIASEKDDTERSDRFFRRWYEAAAWINAGGLIGYGITPATSLTPSLSFVTANYGTSTATDEYSRDC